MKRVLILGSCVSRDIFEFDEAKEFEITQYFARTSFASLSSKPYVNKNILEKIASSFQRRMVQWDMQKHFWEVLKQKNFDFLLLDMIDTRFKLYKVCLECLHTISTEYKKAADKLASSNVIRANSSEFFTLWTKGLQKFIQAIAECGLPQEKIICIKPYWTNLLVGGGNLWILKRLSQ